jgi:hypothetical protein
VKRIKALYDRWMKELEHRVNDWILRGEMRRHKPEPIELTADGLKPQPYCFGCGKPWPCKTWNRISELNREQGRSDG